MNALWDALLGKTPIALKDSNASRPQEDALRLREPAEGPAASLHFDATTHDTFSALELRDRVVIMLLFDQVVQESQVELGWQLWQQMSSEGVREPLWRVLTLFPEVDRELIYAEAARVYGFEKARIERVHALPLVRDLHEQLDEERWEQLVTLRVLPIYEAEQTNSLQRRTVFATHDPTRSEVHTLLEEISPSGFELRYAPEGRIVNLLVEAYPHRYAHLKGLSGVSKDFLSGTAFDELEPALAPGDPIPERLRTAAHDFFEDVLADAVRAGATDVCLLPTPHGETESYIQIGQELRRHRSAGALPGRALVETIKREIIHAEECSDGRIQKELIERTIDDVPMRFRVSAVPASDEVHAECIVVRVVD